jgi:uncharacterized protein
MSHAFYIKNKYDIMIIMKTIQQQSIIDHLSLIKKTFEKEGIIIIGIFGSYAKGTATIYSDIDIAIKKTDDFFQQHSANDFFNTIDNLKHSILEKFKRKIDVVDIGPESKIKSFIQKDIIYV